MVGVSDLVWKVPPCIRHGMCKMAMAILQLISLFSLSFISACVIYTCQVVQHCDGPPVSRWFVSVQAGNAHVYTQLPLCCLAATHHSHAWLVQQLMCARNTSKSLTNISLPTRCSTGFLRYSSKHTIHALITNSTVDKTGKLQCGAAF